MLIVISMGCFKSKFDMQIFRLTAGETEASAVN